MAGNGDSVSGAGLDDDPEEPDPVVAPTRPPLFRVFGPGLITGASDDDPGGIATYSQIGAQFGYVLCWPLLFIYPFMSAVQIISGRIGRTTGHGLAGVLRLHAPGWLLNLVVALLLVANVINLGADLGAMADALTLLLPAPRWLCVLLFAAISIYMQLVLVYTRYVSVLKWLTLALFSYVGALLAVKADWGAFLRGTLLPDIRPALRLDAAWLTAMVALLGTTISPYLFFWQSSEEVEDMHVHPRRIDLIDDPEEGGRAVRRIDEDTDVGMAFSNLIALAVVGTTAATLHPHGITDIETSAQAAQALRPIAGSFAGLVFAVGIIGTGLLAVPVLAGSAAYALGEARQWPTGLERRPGEARAFYATIVLATVIGVIVDFAPVNPMRALYLSAALNGVVAVPVMAVMMVLAARRSVMGEFAVRGWLRALGWAATAIMALVVAAMAVAAFR